MIDNLKQLKLSDYPIAEIDNLMANMGPVAIFVTEYNHTIEIERAVNNTKDEPEFNSVSRISFKPAQYNHNYLRASTPNNTMFYGSVVPLELQESKDEKERRNARIVGMAEVSTLIRSSEVVEGYSRMTFGKWEVVEQLSLATIIDTTKNYDEPYLTKLSDKCKEFLNDVPADIKENTINWLTYFTYEFSKEVSNGNNHDYLISAKFTEKFVNTTGYDGVIYPSVQTNGYGLCVAIHPRAMHKLKLTKVLQCKLTKSLKEDGEHLFQLSNEKNCLVEDNATHFKLNDIK